jgi:hypothetical protein
MFLGETPATETAGVAPEFCRSLANAESKMLGISLGHPERTGTRLRGFLHWSHRRLEMRRGGNLRPVVATNGWPQSGQVEANPFCDAGSRFR